MLAILQFMDLRVLLFVVSRSAYTQLVELHIKLVVDIIELQALVLLLLSLVADLLDHMGIVQEDLEWFVFVISKFYYKIYL